MTTDGAFGPLDTAEQRESVFVFREAFDYPYRERAELTELTETHCRQLHHRACRTARGAMDELEALLAVDVVSTADGGGKATAARRPIVDRAKVARYLAGFAAKHAAGMRLARVELAGFRIVANPGKLAFLARQLSRTPVSSGHGGDEGSTR